MNLKLLRLPLLALFAVSSFAQTNAQRANFLGSGSSEYEAGFRITAFYGIDRSELRATRFVETPGESGNTSVLLRPIGYYINPQMGIQAEYLFSKHFSVTGDVDWGKRYYELEWQAYQDNYYDTILDVSSYGMVSMQLSNLRIPIMARFRYGNRLEASLLAGGYLNLSIKNTIRGFVDNEGLNSPEDLNSLPLLEDGLAPRKARFGVLAGVEVRYDLPFKGDLSLRFRLGRDLTALYRFPKTRVLWSTIQIGYGIDI